MESGCYGILKSTDEDKTWTEVECPQRKIFAPQPMIRQLLRSESPITR